MGGPRCPSGAQRDSRSPEHGDLRALITDGKFREGPFYRLNVVPIRLPPLRERLDDAAYPAGCRMCTYPNWIGRTRCEGRPRMMNGR